MREMRGTRGTRRVREIENTLLLYIVLRGGAPQYAASTAIASSSSSPASAGVVSGGCSTEAAVSPRAYSTVSRSQVKPWKAAAWCSVLMALAKSSALSSSSYSPEHGQRSLSTLEAALRQRLQRRSCSW